LVTTLADTEVDGDNAVLDLADTAEVLPLHARRLGALLDGTGLVDQADDSQTVVGHPRQLLDDLLLAEVADVAGVPVVILEELLEGADRGAGLEGDGFDALAWQFGEESADVGLQVGEGLRVGAAEQVASQKGGQRRP